MDKRIQDLRYIILPGKPSSSHPLNSLHEKAYATWREVWESEFRKLNYPTADLANDFLRQDYIPVIAHGDEIAALHLYSKFNITNRAILDHKYFVGNYPKEFIDNLRGRGIHTVMSMEYLTVNPAWRAKVVGVQLSDVIIGLGTKLLPETEAQVFIGPARNDYKVSQKTYEFGFDCLLANYMNHNVSCDLVAGFREKLKPSPDPVIAALIQKLWRNRWNENDGREEGAEVISLRRAA